MSDQRPNFSTFARTELLERAVLDFLKSNPDSTLLALVIGVRPDLSDLTERDRAVVWFGYKNLLEDLAARGVVTCKLGFGDVPVWRVADASSS